MNYSLSTILPVVLAPFLGFVINIFLVKKSPKAGVALAVAMMLTSFGFASMIFMDFLGTYSTDYYVHKVFTWLDIGTFKVNMGIYLDSPSSGSQLTIRSI